MANVQKISPCLWFDTQAEDAARYYVSIFKNSSVAFAVSVAELTMFAMQAQEETSRGIEVYLAVTACYVVSALIINRLMAFIEKKTRVPGFIVSAGGGGGH